MITRHELKNIKEEPIYFHLKEDKNIINVDSNEEKYIVVVLDKKEADLTIKVKENSQVRVLILSYLQGSIKLNILGNVGRYSYLDLIGGFLNDKSLVNAKIFLDEEGAEAKVNSLIVSNDKQVQRAYYEIVNNAKHTTGNIDVIGITKGSGEVRVDGVGQINKGMVHSNNFQHLTGVMSDESILEMNPLLLIDEHDVKAGHGATIGQMDENALYYMMSRGITKEVAQNLYIKGLISPFVDEIFDGSLCEPFNLYLWGGRLWMYLK